MEKEFYSDLPQLVNQISHSYFKYPELFSSCTSSMPDKKVIIESVHKIRELIFPGYFNGSFINTASVPYYIGEMLANIEEKLTEQIFNAFLHRYNTGEHNRENICINQVKERLEKKAETICLKFFRKLPEIRDYVATDLQAAFDGDPAAVDKEQIISSYPGLFAISVYRIAHEFHLLGVPMIPRIITEYAHNETGIDIHPGAEIGRYFFIDHGTGVVIGETTHIGSNVKIYQGVTLGALSTRGGQTLRDVKRHPTIEDNVTIYSGVSVLGGETVIGKNVIIGGNAFITTSVPADTRVSVKNPELQLKDSPPQEFSQEFVPDWII